MIKLCLFGAVSINDTEGNDLRAALVQTKRTALLAYLTVARPRNSHRRETLLGLFWPDLAEERARRALNQAVYYLRTRLGAESIAVRSADEIALSRAHIACDVVDFENLLAAGEEEKALALYHGPLMDGFHLNDLLEFERWLEIERARLHERAARAAWTLADRAAEAGGAQDAIAWARRSMELSRDEGAVRHLISMRDRFGDRAGAIREYDRFARQLARELEADPSPETQELIAQIRLRSGTGTPIAPRRAIKTPERASERTPKQGVTTAATNVIAASETTDAIAAPRDENVDHARNSSRWRFAFLLVSLPLIALFAWVVNREIQSRSETPIMPGTVAILPFSYTGSIDHADAPEAVVNMLDANIENAGGIHTVDWRALKSFVERSTTGQLSLAGATAAARRFNAEWYIVGAVTEAGDRIRVTAAAYDRRSGETPQVTAIAEGDVRQLFGIADELTAKLLPVLSGQSGKLHQSALLTTSSIPALREYLDGESDFREARYVSALQKFRRAVESDSAFALAYFRLSQSAELLGETGLAMWAATQALEQGRGLGRYERQHAEAWRLTLEGRVREAETAYRSLVSQDTTDVEALQQLAYLHFSWGPRTGNPASESGREWRRVLNRDPYNPVALVHLLRLVARDGNRDEFTWLAGRIERFGPESDRALELKALKAFVFDDSAARPVVLRDLSMATPAAQRKAVASVLTSASDLRSASALAERYLSLRGAAGDQSESWLRPALALARGRIQEAIKATAPAVTDGPGEMLSRGVVLFLHPESVSPAEIRTSRDRFAAAALTGRSDTRTRSMLRYVAGLLDLRLGETASAERAASILANTRDGRGGAQRLSRLLQAELALATGKHAEALAILGDPVAEGNRVPAGFAFPVAHERFLRAELLRELKRPVEALRWYATFPDPGGYDLWYAGRATQRLAEMYATIGNRDASAKFRSRLAGMWRDADVSD